MEKNMENEMETREFLGVVLSCLRFKELPQGLG